MTLPRLVGLTFVALLALAAVMAPMASASNHEFAMLPTGSKAFTSTSGTAVLTAGTNVITCASNATSGEITQMDAVTKLKVKFVGCKTANGGPVCTAKSVGAAEGEIATVTLKGQLGTVKTTEAATGVGLLLSPETGSKFVVIAANACTPETSVNGSVAGEISPVKKLQSTGKLIIGVTGGVQNIKSIAILGVNKSAELEAFGLAATQQISNELAFPGGPVEIV